MISIVNKVLLVRYTQLCLDEAWDIRKTCVDLALYMSCTCSQELREYILAPLFTRLLNDKCREVRIAAFEILGPFISTFAVPPITSMGYNYRGEHVVLSGDRELYTPINDVRKLFLALDDLTDEEYERASAELEETQPHDVNQLIDEFLKSLSENNINLDIFRAAKCRSKNVIPNENSDTRCDNLDSKISTISSQMRDIAISDTVTTGIKVDQLEIVDLKNNAQTNINESLHRVNGETKSKNVKKDEDDLESFNSYNYWYVPPQMPLDLDLSGESETEKTVSNTVNISEQVKFNVFCDDFETNNLNATVCKKSSLANITFDSIDQDDILLNISSSDPYELKEPPQKIVPQVLIDHFISMVDPRISLNLEDNVAYHCAYSLPAVAVTLGTDNSYLLKPVVPLLADNMHYRVRHSLASSLHELARIWGTDVASTDLTPIFNDFMNDLDEVRIGILQNLATFLKLITPNKRLLCLPRLSCFLQDSQQINWRYRYELAKQLVELVTMFTPEETSKYIADIAVLLLCDKVAAVRQMTIKLTAQLLNHFNGERALSSPLLQKLTEAFACSKNWKLRQTYVLLCSELLVTQALPMDQFVCEIMPHFLDLTWDSIANVKIVVAQTIFNHMIDNKYFRDPENELNETLETVLSRLQSDEDHDVRQSALPKPIQGPEPHYHHI